MKSKCIYYFIFLLSFGKIINGAMGIGFLCHNNYLDGSYPCASGMICNSNIPWVTGNSPYRVCTLICTDDYQCTNENGHGKCVLQTEQGGGQTVKGCQVLDLSVKVCYNSGHCGAPFACNRFTGRCDGQTGPGKSCSTTTGFCNQFVEIDGCHPGLLTDETSWCVKMCTSDEDCGLRLIGACKLQTEIKSDLPKKFCTNVDKNNHYGTDLRPGEDCPPGTTPNQYLFKCLRPFRKFGEVCGKATGHGKTISQCGVDIACNPSLINPTCTKICTSHTDCFDNQNQYSCVSMADAVDGWPSKFCNVGKAPQCISNPQCVSKGSLFTCNLFTLQCVLPEGIPIGFPCAPLGNPCYKSVCNSQVKRCTLPCEGVNAHCGSPSNPGTCVLEQDITKSSDTVYVCKLNYIPPGCSTANYCTSPSVCNRYSYTCETRPTIGQRCMASALSCAAPYVCNHLTKSKDSFCTTPCASDGNCLRNNAPGNCIPIKDLSLTGTQTQVCSHDDTTRSCKNENECIPSDVCNLFTLKCETFLLRGQSCITGGTPCVFPFVCNALVTNSTTFICDTACDDNCDNNFICTETVDPTFNGGPIKVCVAPESCGPTKQCEEGLVCNPFGFNGSSCTQTCLFNSECNVGEGETCKVINDPANVGKIILVCVPSNYAQCDVLNPCSFPEACDLKNSLCQTMPGYGESCNLKGIQCKIGYTCNRYSISDDERFSCTRACDDNDDCGNNGRCITTFDSINEKAVSVCRGEGNPCTFGRCPQYQLCNPYLYKCYDDPDYHCEDKITSGRNSCESMKHYCDKPEHCQFLTENCRKSCNRCYSTYKCPVTSLRNTTSNTPYRPNFDRYARPTTRRYYQRQRQLLLHVRNNVS